jgi:hypothetical protein
MAKKYYQTFVVRTSFTFPIDMLRYDGCFPDSEQDSGKIARNLTENKCRLEVKIGRYVDHKNSTPCVGRWQSFGCQISDIKFR